MTRAFDRSGLATVPPREHLWTREEYHAMGRAGLFDGKRVELIEGKVVEMSPIGPKHWVAVNLTDQAIRGVFGDGFIVSAQNAIAPNPRSEPQPDVAVVPGEARDYIEGLPKEAVLVIEISDSSLELDRTEKARLYAKSGIGDYWIVNLVEDRVEVMRDPVPDRAQPYEFGYSSREIYRRGQGIKPLAAPHAQVRVEDLLP
jgi:Uma2 family endonuclease